GRLAVPRQPAVPARIANRRGLPGGDREPAQCLFRSRIAPQDLRCSGAAAAAQPCLPDGLPAEFSDHDGARDVQYLDAGVHAGLPRFQREPRRRDVRDLSGWLSDRLGRNCRALLLLLGLASVAVALAVLTSLRPASSGVWLPVAVIGLI